MTDDAIRGLRAHFRGELVRPGDAGYDESRALFNGMIDRRPALFARCTGAEDVAAAIAFARERGLPLAVKTGGHAVSGASLVDGGVVLDMRPMNGIAIDPDARTARVGGGALWSEFDRAAQEHGLATTGGRVSTTGVAGLTLGGGSGWLERRFGLACDNLLAVEIVTADGELVRASATENPELFWALHGGGGNFGVATALEFRLHPVGPTVLAGVALHRPERGREALELLRELVDGAPDELGCAFGYFGAPPEDAIPEHLRGRLVAVLAVCWTGDLDEGEELLRPVREFGPPEADLIGPMPYVEFQCSLDDPPGYRNYWSAEYVDDLSDDALDVVCRHGEGGPFWLSQTFILPWGGAVGRVPEDATPLARRDAAYVVHPLAFWENPADDARNVAWVKGFMEEMRQFASGGVYLNFVGDEGDERIRAAFGDAHERLAAVKARYDPENVFRSNQNIRPAAAVTA